MRDESITAESLFAAGHLKWTKYGPGTLGAFVAEMDYGTAPAVTAALHDAVDRMLFGYLPPAMGEAMQAACAAWQADTYGWKVDATRIRPLPDVIRGLEIAIEHCSPPGSPVILPVPAYMPFLEVPAPPRPGDDPGRDGRATATDTSMTSMRSTGRSPPAVTCSCCATRTTRSGG